MSKCDALLCSWSNVSSRRRLLCETSPWFMFGDRVPEANMQALALPRLLSLTQAVTRVPRGVEGAAPIRSFNINITYFTHSTHVFYVANGCPEALAPRRRARR